MTAARPRPLATIALLVLAALLAVASGQDVEIGNRAFDLARNLRCPVCVSESVADSSAQIAQQMRSLIQEKVDEGLTDQQIYAFFQERYGDWILLTPPKRGVHLVVWLLPALVGLGAVAFVAVLARRWLAASRAPVSASEAELARVRHLLAEAPPADGAAVAGPATGDVRRTDDQSGDA